MFYTKSRAQEFTKLPEFNLLGIDDNYYSNDGFNQYENLGIVFYSNHCRVSQKFDDLIKRMAKLFAEKNSILIAVSPNYEKSILPDEKAYSEVGDSFQEMKIRARLRKFNFLYLYDGKDQDLAKKMGVTATPHAFIYNKERKLIYNGRIGDFNRVNDLKASDFFETFAHKTDERDYFLQTKVFGSAIKTIEDLKLADEVRRRYSEEKIRVSHATKKKIEFFLTHPSEKPKLVYVWSIGDDENRENLLAMSSIFKIFRKRGLKVYTICVGTNLLKTKEILEKAQLSTTNFLLEGRNFSPLAKYHPNEGNRITPFLALLDKKGNLLVSHSGLFDPLFYKIKIIEALKEPEL